MLLRFYNENKFRMFLPFFFFNLIFDLLGLISKLFKLYFCRPSRMKRRLNKAISAGQHVCCDFITTLLPIWPTQESNTISSALKIKHVII